jgi:hypothetical protein
MDLLRYEEMNSYNKVNPPLHIMVARYLGMGEKPSTARTPTAQDLTELMSQFPQAPQVGNP